MPPRKRIVLYALLALAVVAALVVVGVSASDDDGGADPETVDAAAVRDDRDTPKPAVVKPGPDPEVVETTITDGWEQAERYKAGLQVKLRAGNRPAKLVALETRVLQAAWLPPCVTLADGGNVSGGGYIVSLPPRPARGFERVRPLKRTLEPNEADRFRIAFETPGIDAGIVALYEVEMAIRYRGAGKPLPLGRYVAMTPFTVKGTEWKYTLATGGRARQQANEQQFLGYGPGEESLRCFRSNRQKIAPFLTSDSERTESLDDVLEFVESSSDVPVPDTP